MFQGSIVALITPFQNGRLDEESFARLIEWQIGEGTHGLVPCGTTGESPTLSHAEHERVIDLCIEVAAGRVPVIAGAGSNATEEAISLTRHAKAAGADAALLVTPYYNKPSQEGLYQHYRAIAHAVDLPLILYNVPGRTNVDIHTETLARLAADCPTIVGVKDATADLNRPLAIRARIGPDFCLLSGEDATALAFLASGGVGCISVTANVAPGPCARLQDAWREGRVEEAMALNHRLFPLHHALFLEPSPQPVKYAASRLGLAGEALRLPLVPISEATRKAVRDAMAAAGIDNQAAPS